MTGSENSLIDCSNMEICFLNQIPAKPIFCMWVDDTNNFFELVNYYLYWESKVRIIGNYYCFIKVILKTID